MTRGELTDDEWTVFEPLLPLGERGPIPDLRRLVNGVMWRFRTGGPRRGMPERYGPWSTVYGRVPPLGPVRGLPDADGGGDRRGRRARSLSRCLRGAG
ncbi:MULTISPECIES: transposase [unclassified Streptomyces]|uniref:transposase n=1 Tax=unclassified Streptomyces TaxID=2593676 RepID=UPI0036E26864